MEGEEVCGWRRRCTKALREYVAQESLTLTVKNNRIKVIIRSGYGYRNLENLGLRILMTNHSSSYAAALC